MLSETRSERPARGLWQRPSLSIRVGRYQACQHVERLPAWLCLNCESVPDRSVRGINLGLRIALNSNGEFSRFL